MTRLKTYINNKELKNQYKLEINNNGDKKPNECTVRYTGNTRYNNNDILKVIIDKVNLDKFNSCYCCQYNLRDEFGTHDVITPDDTTVQYLPGYTGTSLHLPSGNTISLPAYNKNIIDMSFWLNCWTAPPLRVKVFQLNDDCTIHITHGSIECRFYDDTLVYDHSDNNVLFDNNKWNYIRIVIDVVHNNCILQINDKTTTIPLPVGYTHTIQPIIGEPDGTIQTPTWRIQNIRILHNTLNDVELKLIRNTPEPRHLIRYGGYITNTKSQYGENVIQSKSFGLILDTTDIISENYESTIPDIIQNLIENNTTLGFIDTMPTTENDIITYYGNKKLIECIKDLVALHNVNFTVDIFGNLVLYEKNLKIWDYTIHENIIRKSQSDDNITDITVDIPPAESTTRTVGYNIGGYSSGPRTFVLPSGTTAVNSVVQTRARYSPPTGIGYDVVGIGDGNTIQHTVNISAGTFTITDPGVINLWRSSSRYGGGIFTIWFTVNITSTPDPQKLRGNITQQQSVQHTTRKNITEFGDIETGRQYVLERLTSRSNDMVISAELFYIWAPFLDGDIIQIHGLGNHIIKSTKLQYPEGIITLVCSAHDIGFYEYDFENIARIHVLESNVQDTEPSKVTDHFDVISTKNMIRGIIRNPHDDTLLQGILNPRCTMQGDIHKKQNAMYLYGPYRVKMRGEIEFRRGYPPGPNTNVYGTARYNDGAFYGYDDTRQKDNAIYNQTRYNTKKYGKSYV